MIVHTPVKSDEGSEVCVSSTFEMEKPLAYVPTALWYRFPKRFTDRINDRADTFGPAALLIAMYAGEDLYIRGEISPRMAYNLLEYREIYHTWYPKLFKRVELKYQKLARPVSFNGDGAVGAAFSGGVDSFYTLWAHMSQNQRISDARITHGLFVHGLDLRLDDKTNYDNTADIYSGVFDGLGLELIRASTNAYQFSEFRLNWTMFYGVSLIGAALLLGSWMRRFYVPSGIPSYNQLLDQGSSPLIDHLLSTETTEIVHHGASVSRYEKISALSAWDVTHHRLRVCSDKIRMHGVSNCSSCHKCYRTMALLEIRGVLNNYNNFSRRMTVIDFLRWGLLFPLNPDIESGIKSLAFKSGHIRIGFWIQVAIFLYGFQNIANRLIKGFLSREQLFRLKRRIFRPESHVSG